MVGGISNLLASITGEKPVLSQKPSPVLTRPNPPVKRKAEGDLRNDGVKRPSPNPTVRPSTVKPADKPADKPAATPSRLSSMSRPPERPGLLQNTSTTRLSKSLPPKANGASQRSMTGASSKADGTKLTQEPAPKKGSFKEIMARAERAREKFGQVGKIQHKRVERGPSKKEKDETKTETRPLAKKAGPTRPGTAKPGATATAPSRPGKDPLARDGRSSTTAKGASSHKTAGKEKISAKDLAEQAQKKRRMAPSTGYSGTARPNPTAQASRPKSAAPTGGVLLNPNPKLPRYGGARRSRYEEEDDDMSDFINDDEDIMDEEEGMGRRHYYSDSEGSSDMEAGLDEIDDEEEMSAYQAKRDDQAEAALERRLKEEKERKKRDGLVASRYRR